MEWAWPIFLLVISSVTSQDLPFFTSSTPSTFNRLNDNRFGSNDNRFGSNDNRFGSNDNRFGSNDNRFGANDNRFGANDNRFGDNRFNPNENRFGNEDRFGDNRFGDNRFNEPVYQQSTTRAPWRQYETQQSRGSYENNLIITEA